MDGQGNIMARHSTFTGRNASHAPRLPRFKKKLDENGIINSNLIVATISNPSVVPAYIFAGLHQSRFDVSENAIYDAVCKHFNLYPDDLRGEVRTKEMVKARSFLYYTLRKFKELSFPYIAIIAKRDHSSVMHLVAKFEDEIGFYEDLRKEYKEFLDTLHSDWAATI